MKQGKFVYKALSYALNTWMEKNTRSIRKKESAMQVLYGKGYNKFIGLWYQQQSHKYCYVFTVRFKNKTK